MYVIGKEPLQLSTKRVIRSAELRDLYEILISLLHESGIRSVLQPFIQEKRKERRIIRKIFNSNKMKILSTAILHDRLALDFNICIDESTVAHCG